MPEARQQRLSWGKAICREALRKEIGIAPGSARPFSYGSGRPQVVVQVHRAKQRLARVRALRKSDLRRVLDCSGRHQRLKREFPACRRFCKVPGARDQRKKRIHKNDRRVCWTAIRRHTASKFLSPVSFALRTHPLRRGGNMRRIQYGARIDQEFRRWLWLKRQQRLERNKQPDS